MAITITTGKGNLKGQEQSQILLEGCRPLPTPMTLIIIQGHIRSPQTSEMALTIDEGQSEKGVHTVDALR